MRPNNTIKRATIDVVGPEPTALQFDVRTVGEALKQAIGVDVDLRIVSERQE